jgi:hypothetical protein
VHSTSAPGLSRRLRHGSTTPVLARKPPSLSIRDGDFSCSLNGVRASYVSVSMVWVKSVSSLAPSTTNGSCSASDALTIILARASAKSGAIVKRGYVAPATPPQISPTIAGRVSRVGHWADDGDPLSFSSNSRKSFSGGPVHISKQRCRVDPKLGPTVRPTPITPSATARTRKPVSSSMISRPVHSPAELLPTRPNSFEPQSRQISRF